MRRKRWARPPAAHLRAGGAAVTPCRGDVFQRGASPRGRSSHDANGDLGHGQGRISARAEQPSQGDPSAMNQAAHLRAGGAADAGTWAEDELGGASPRGRSSRPRDRHPAAGAGRISARAEQPARASSGSRRTTAHLRAGGAASSSPKSSPGMPGASPRGRSSLKRGTCDHLADRRISARAEQPTAPSSVRVTRGAHLRAGGAAHPTRDVEVDPYGASPRGRSSRDRGRGDHGGARRISARAEQPLPHLCRARRVRAHLRAGGAAARDSVWKVKGAGASPRGRSSRRAVPLEQRVRRRISARAEQPRSADSSPRRTTAHLRAGGAASLRYIRPPSSRGASPRGRSSHADLILRVLEVGRISARAEQPCSAPRPGRRRRAHLRAGGAARFPVRRASRREGASPRGRSSPRRG